MKLGLKRLAIAERIGDSLRHIIKRCFRLSAVVWFSSKRQPFRQALSSYNNSLGLCLSLSRIVNQLRSVFWLCEILPSLSTSRVLSTPSMWSRALEMDMRYQKHQVNRLIFRTLLQQILRHATTLFHIGFFWLQSTLDIGDITKHCACDWSNW